MQKFSVLTAPAAPFPFAHVDTDQIIPANYMTTVTKRGLGKGLFAAARYDAVGREVGDFVLNRPEWRAAGILIAHENFGCGSSREHAPWALSDFGISCVIAPSFGDIFRINCLKNGLAPIRAPREQCDELIAAALARPGAMFTVDMERQRISLPDGRELAFAIDARERAALLAGVDDIARTLRHETRVEAYEAFSDALA